MQERSSRGGRRKLAVLLFAPFILQCYGRDWHKADIAECTAHVRFRGKADMTYCNANVCL